MLLKNKRKSRDETNKLLIFRTNTENVNLSAYDLNAHQLNLGNLGINYHFVIDAFGKLEKVIPIDAIGEGSDTAISVCIVGGKNDKKNLSENQSIALNKIKQFINEKYNKALTEEYV